MPSVPPNPRLGKSQALNMGQTNQGRIGALVPTFTTQLSPVTVYQPGASGGVGNELIAETTVLPINVAQSYGVWVAPDVNGDGSIWYATVECFGGGGGAGGGNHTQGGGGGGGGEYAREDQYPITPGQNYAYIVGMPGAGGFNNGNAQVSPGSAGTAGGTTIFDMAGTGLAGGVVANGGGAGDNTFIGIGGAGGTGSTNTVHFNGGAGGTNISGNGSDNPETLIQTSGFFQQNTLNPNLIHGWWRYDDSPDYSGKINDQSFSSNTGTITQGTGGLTVSQPNAPAQAPTATVSASPPFLPNATMQGSCSWFKLGTNGKFSATVAGTIQTVSGKYTTISGWIKPDPSGTWGATTASNQYGVIAANGQNYQVGASSGLQGHALYLYNAGTAGAPVWQLYFATGNGTHMFQCHIALTPVVGTWVYVVATYNNGNMNLNVNNGAFTATVSTAANYTSVPNGTKVMTMGTDPNGTSNPFYGFVSNFWFADDAILNGGIAQAFGTTPATGGAGGGASGGPSTAGGAGATAGGATGGAGGTPATQPASLLNVTTAAMGGFAGANAGLGNAGPATPAGGPCGGGGGGSGDMTSPPNTTVLTIPFTVAATYNGPDAGTGPGQPYNTSQQNHPSSGVNSLLYAGGLATDTSTGSKNTLLLLPKGLATTVGNAAWTVQNIFLTFTNAFPTNTVESILEIGYTGDTVLPQTYLGASLVDAVGAALIPVGSGTITYDLSSSTLAASIASGAATALILGPGQFPTFDAFSAQTGPQFYCSIYGPGAADAFGNNEYPYLTIVLQKTITTQQGSAASGGGIFITQVNNTNTPVAFVQPFAGTDANGNGYAQGFTGPSTAWNPADNTPGSFAAETWHPIPLDAGWANVAGRDTCQYRILPDGSLQLRGCAQASGGLGASKTLNNSNPLPSPWTPSNTHDFRTGDATGTRAHMTLNSSGVITAFYWSGGSGSAIAEIDAVIPVP